MANNIEELYMLEVEKSNILRDWVDKMADFILSEHFYEPYINKEQWKKERERIVRKICLGV